AVMQHLPFALAALAFAVPVHAQTLAAAADQALVGDTLAWDFVEGITTEVGPRQAGTEAEARGRAWALDWLRRQGFDRVAEEPYTMPTWVRGEERAEVLAPFAQPMHVTALGNSAATPAGGLTAEVVGFMS